jgi:predicted PurR-regulated permease PerM
MANGVSTKAELNKPCKISYLVIAGTLILAGCLHLATPLIVALFGYFALAKLHFSDRWPKWPAVLFLVVIVAGLTYGLGHFVHDTVKALPEIADKAVPSVIELAQRWHIELPFDDYDSLRAFIVEGVKNQANYMGSAVKFARGATSEVLFIIVGLVVAIAVFLNPRLERGRESQPIRHNLYSLCCEAIEERFAIFYRSFATVMGAQIVISTINTGLTAGFVLAVHLPYALVVIGGTFLCGLLPVVGNLISNTVVVGIGFTISPSLALAALVFLVVVHKLEYFLNSKIVGDRIRTPLWLTLLGLIIGERLMGIPGMILAPVALNYIRLEASQIDISK